VGGKNIKMIGQKRTEGEVEEKGGGRKEKVESEQECICCTIKQLSVKVHQIILLTYWLIYSLKTEVLVLFSFFPLF
jgi:hypothetical protein